MNANEAKHTPGPWFQYNSIGSKILQNWYIWGGNGDSVAKVLGDEPSGEQAANARLIAAAPDLLEAGNAAVSVLTHAVARVKIANDEGNQILSAWLEDAEAALAGLDAATSKTEGRA